MIVGGEGADWRLLLICLLRHVLLLPLRNLRHVGGMVGFSGLLLLLLDWLLHLWRIRSGNVVTQMIRD